MRQANRKICRNQNSVAAAWKNRQFSRQLKRTSATPPPAPLGLPLLRLEKLTFRFVVAGFVVLSATLLLGWAILAQPMFAQDAPAKADAFWQALENPGGEAHAISLARPNAKEFLALLRAHGAQKKVPLPRLKLIEGDLLLALGQKQEALACYRAVAARIGDGEKQGWDQGFVPAERA